MIPWLMIQNFAFVMVIIGLWSVFWKGWALWRAARKEQKAWYIALLILNTMGILPILYLVFFSKNKKKKK
jgi:hypothetical protein